MRNTYKMMSRTMMFISSTTVSSNIYCLVALALLALCTNFSQLALAESPMSSTMRKLKITPELIDNIPDDVKNIKVELHGNLVKPGDPVPAKNFKDLNMAKISWEVDNYEARHTLLLLDLDRKPGLNKTQNIYNQFTSFNIPGNVITAGQAIVAFETPIVPCHPSTKHRILMLAFHQAQNIDLSDVMYMSASSGDSSKRENFKLEDFMRRHRLSLVAANVFLAIGEATGVCSGSGLTTTHSIQSVSSILIAMVTVTISFLFAMSNTSRRNSIY